MWKTMGEIASFKADYQLAYKRSVNNALLMGVESELENKFIPISTGYCNAESRMSRGNSIIPSIEIGESASYADSMGIDERKLHEFELNYLIELKVELNELEGLSFTGFIPESCKEFTILRQDTKNAIGELQGLAFLGRTSIIGMNNLSMKNLLFYSTEGTTLNDGTHEFLISNLDVENLYLLSPYYKISYCKFKNVALNLDYISCLQYSKADKVVIYGYISPEIYLDKESLASRLKYDIINIKSALDIEGKLEINYYVVWENKLTGAEFENDNVSVKIFTVQSKYGFAPIDEQIRQNYLSGIETENLWLD